MVQSGKARYRFGTVWYSTVTGTVYGIVQYGMVNRMFAEHLVGLGFFWSISYINQS